MKKGQVSMYVIIGIVLIILVAGALLLFNKNKKAEMDLGSDSVQFSGVRKDNIQNFVEDCMKDSLIEAIVVYGLPYNGEAGLTNEVLSTTLKCIDAFNVFSDEYEITYGVPTADLNLDDSDVISYVLYLPVEAIKNGESFTFEKFQYDFSKSVYSRDFDNGVATKDIRLESVDRKSILMIPKGTEVTDSEGNPIEYVSLKLKDKRADGQRNSFVVGNLVYEGIPDGAQFSQPVEFRFEYSDQDIENLLEAGTTEEDITCTYLADSGFHVPWPSLVDVENNVLTCEIEHFTDNTINAGCGDTSLDAQPYVITDIKVFRPNCFIPEQDICDIEGFVTCTQALEDEELHCSKVFADVEGRSSPFKEAVFMTEFNENVQTGQIGYTNNYNDCELDTWMYMDDMINTCACQVYEDGAMRDCESDEVEQCYTSCRDEAALSDSINNGPIKTDGIADDEDVSNEVTLETESGQEYTYENKGCGCFIDRTSTTADLTCGNVVPAPMTWGWDSAKGGWDIVQNAPVTEYVNAVDGIGTYYLNFKPRGDACFNPEDFSVFVQWQPGDTITMYLDNNHVVSDEEGSPKGELIVDYDNFETQIMAFLDPQPEGDDSYIPIQERFIDISVNNEQETLDEKPQCAFITMELSWMGANVDVFSDPKDSLCGVDVYNRVFYDCGCPTNQSEITSCLSNSQCIRDIDASGDAEVVTGLSVCADNLPTSCMSLVGNNEIGGYCDESGPQCLGNVDLLNEPDCMCGTNSHTAGTKELCCGSDLVGESDLPEGSNFDCSARSNLKNTCAYEYTNGVEWVCLPSCGDGYEPVGTRTNQFEEIPRCPIYNPITGFAEGFDECCRKVTQCVDNTPNNEPMSIGETIVRNGGAGETLCYLCDSDGTVREVEYKSAECPRFPGVLGDQCDGATCDTGMVCCQHDDENYYCTLEDECDGDVDTCGNNIIDGDDQCDFDYFDPTCLTHDCYVWKSNDGYCSDRNAGLLTCDRTSCETSDASCTCGNDADTLDSGEVCDYNADGVIIKSDSSTCLSLTGNDGTLGCKSDCSDYDETMCTCGNGDIDDGEECDGSNLDGKTCASISIDGPENKGTLLCNPETCKFDVSHCTCGDGIDNEVDDPSKVECDEGDDNVAVGSMSCDYGVEECQKCSRDCVLYNVEGSYCGDGTHDSEEECDNGELNSDDTADACRIDCKNPRCGDGTPDSGEECDTGALNSNTISGACRTDCKSASCGDDVIDPGEECEADGDGTAEDDQYKCTSCNWVGGYCGDDSIKPEYDEECEVGDVRDCYDLDSSAYKGGQASCTDGCSWNYDACQLRAVCPIGEQITGNDIGCDCNGEPAQNREFCCNVWLSSPKICDSNGCGDLGNGCSGFFD